MASVELQGITKRFGAVEVIRGIDLTVPDGSFTALLGPSGCGKSTLLRMIAGLEEITAGRALIGGADMTAVEPAQRGVAMVFQSYALYPHLTVEQNICFSMSLAGRPKAEQKEKAERIAKMLQLEPLMKRRPAELSGGQRQRVAIGRALVRDPVAFLFDEPLSNLDALLRVQMRIELAKLHQDLGTTMIYVTHDQVEAMTLADKIVVLRKGRVEQVGKPLDLYHDPDNKFVAGFIGSPAMNFLAATAGNGAASVAGLAADVATKARLPAAGAKVTVGLRPQHLSVTAGETHVVEVTEALGGVSYIHVTAPTGEKLVIEAKGNVIPAAGSRVGVGFDAGEALFFDDKEMRLR